MHPDSLNDLVKRYLGLADFELHTREAWASERPDSRTEMRQFIFDNVEADASALDLSVTPKLSRRSLSISHNREIGGFAVAGPKASIGFDLEINDRVREELVNRVSAPGELEAAPSAAALWVAKEAAYKSLFGPRQPLGLADIEIGEWQNETRGAFTCRVVKLQGNRLANSSRGLVTTGRRLSASVFTSPEELQTCAGS